MGERAVAQEQGGGNNQEECRWWQDQAVELEPVTGQVQEGQTPC